MWRLILALAHCEDTGYLSAEIEPSTSPLRCSGYLSTGVQADIEPSTSLLQGSGYLSTGVSVEIDASTSPLRGQCLLEHGREPREGA